MITYWQVLENGLLPLGSFEKDCVVNVVNPTQHELDSLKSTLNIPDDFLADVLDVDERSRIEYDDGNMLMIYRIPVLSHDNGVPFMTVPIGIVIASGYTVIICQRKNRVLDDFFSRNDKKRINFRNQVELILHLFNRANLFFHRYLKEINLQTNLIEKDLEKSTKNKELHKMLRMGKCLVYFSTSLRSNELLINKLRNSRVIEKDEQTEDLFDELLIENKQAIEMATIYTDIQNSMMDGISSIISNNLNNIMKQLTIITIMLMIPNLIAGFFGMNVPNYLEENGIAFFMIIVASVILTVTGVVLFRKKKWW